MEAAIKAQPKKSGSEVPYSETIRHTAFGSDIKATGTYIVTDRDTLLRQQHFPKAEELEIGLHGIIVRRNGSETHKPIPKSLQPTLLLLRSLIMGTPSPLELVVAGDLTRTETGWRLTMQSADGRGHDLVLVGCGDELRGLEIKVSDVQRRSIWFRTP